MDDRLVSNGILSVEDKEALLSSKSALLINGWANNNAELNKLDECIIGILGETPEEIVAVYSYERLAVVFWLIACGSDSETDLEEWREIDCNGTDSNGDAYELWDAIVDLDRNYILNLKLGSPVIVSEDRESDRFQEAVPEDSFLFRGEYLPIVSINSQ